MAHHTVAVMQTNEHTRKNLLDYLVNYGLYLAIVCLVAFFAIKEQNFFTFDNLFSIVMQAGYLIVVAFGVMMTILVKGIDLSVGGVLAFSAILGGMLLRNTQNVLLGILAMLCVASCWGLFNGLIVEFFKIPPFITTMATMNITRGLSLYLTKGESISGFPRSFRSIGWSEIGPIPITLLIALVIYLVGVFVLKKTTFGRRLYAVGGNRDASNIAGVNIRWIVVAAYVLSGLMAGVGGVMLSARLNASRSIMANNLQMDAIAAVVIGGASLDGGKGSITGSLIGAILIAIIRNGLNLMELEYFYQLVITGAIIIGAVAMDSVKRMRES